MQIKPKLYRSLTLTFTGDLTRWMKALTQTVGTRAGVLLEPVQSCLKVFPGLVTKSKHAHITLVLNNNTRGGSCLESRQIIVFKDVIFLHITNDSF